MGNNTILSADQTFTDWFGYKPEDMLGQSVVDYVLESRALLE